MPNVGPYIYDVRISGCTRSSIYIYDIGSLRVKGSSLIRRRNDDCEKDIVVDVTETRPRVGSS